jgi:hypothetical protein
MPVQLIGTLTPRGGVPTSVQVADLSRGGACCRLAVPARTGSEVELRLEGLAARAIVCWASEGRLGLRFLEPLRASELLIQAGRSRSGTWPARPFHAGAARSFPRRTG